MASFSEEDGILRLPAASPCRRDYQLRSSSPQTSDCESSRPQSPWLPRSQLQQSEEPMSPLRLYESSAAIDRPISRSGPLPSTSRSYSYCSPLPSPSPLPSYFSGAAGPGVLTSPRGYRQSSSFVGRLPSSGWESSEDRAVEEAAPPCLRSTRFSPSPTNLRRRNCVSGELGRNFEMLQALSEARKCKSGEIVGLDKVRADVIFPIPESRKAEVRKHRPPGFVLWEALNDADNVSSRRRLSSSAAIVPIPFKWEETSAGKASASQTTTASEQAQISEKAMSQPGATKPVAPSPDVGGASAVPFKWEVAPGKPKLEEKASITSADAAAAAAPALQLPPRLASAASLKRNSWALSPQPSRARSLSASVSAPVAKLQQHSHRLSEELPSPRAAKPRGFSGALSQFGTPQYQSAEYNSLCEDSSNSARSPTSTLCGPGTPSSSSSNSSSRKPSVSFSQSAESFDPWSYGDHATSTSTTSRHSYAEPHVEDSSVKRRHDEGDPMVDAIVKLRRNLKLKAAKPPKSPVQAPPSHNCNNGYSFQGEEFFDCQAHASSPSPSRAHNSAERPPSDVEDEVKPPTRLPYKMLPSPSPARDVAPPSPTPRAAAPDFVNCLALPRFLSKGDTSPNHWVENPSWNAPIDAPARSTLEDGYRSPAYKATLDLFSPSPELMSKKSMKLRNSSLRRRHPHLVEVLCNTLKQSLLRCTKRSVSRTHSIALYDDQIAKRHQSFMW